MSKVASFLDEYGFSSNLDRQALPGAEPGGDAGGGVAAGGGAPFLVKEVTTSSGRNLGHLKKRQFLTEESVKVHVKKYGVNSCAFLTLTFENELRPDGTFGYPPVKEMMKRLRSLASNVLNEEFLEWIRVYERGEKHNRPHFHFFVVTKFKDIRTGFDFETLAKARDCRDLSERRKLTKIYSASACPDLKAQWPKWRGIAKRYGFGSTRVEFIPVKSAKNCGAYIGAYLGKGFGFRNPEDKGLRMLGAKRGSLCGTLRMNIVSPGDWLRRKKTEVAAKILGVKKYEEFKLIYGPKWAYKFRDFIHSIDLVEHYGEFTYPDSKTVIKDGRMTPDEAEHITGPITFTRISKHSEPLDMPIDQSDITCPPGVATVSELPLDLWIEAIDSIEQNRSLMRDYADKMPPPLYQPKGCGLKYIEQAES